MAHDPYVMMINQALDGQISGPDYAALRQHSESCPACALMWRRMAHVDSLFASQPQIGPRPDFAASVMARVAVYESQRRWRPWFLAALTGILLVAVLNISLPFVVLALGLHRPLLEWPLVSELAAQITRNAKFAADVVAALANGIVAWITYVTTDPLALAVVVAALVLASTWIGLREASRQSPPAVEPHRA